MTHPPHHLKKAALLVAATWVFLAPAAGLAQPPLRVRLQGASIVVPTSVLDAAIDVDRTRPVTVRGPGGQRTTTAGGTSALRLAQLMGIDPASVTAVGVQTMNTKGSFTPEVSFTGDELRNGFGGDPLCSSCQATFDHVLTPDTVDFFRPLRDASDANEPDLVRPAARQSLYVRIESAPTIFPRLTLSDRTPRADQPVRFRVVSSPSANVTFAWYYGDGTTGTGAEVTKRYAAGSWPVAVIAHDGTGFGVASAMLQVKAPPSLDPSNDRDSGLSGDVPTPTPRPKSVAPAGGASSGAGAGGGAVAGSGAGSQTGSQAGATTPGATTPAAPTTGSAAAAPGATIAPTTPSTPGPSPSPAPAAAGGTPVAGQLVSAGPKPSSLAGAITAADALARQTSPSGSAPQADGAGGASLVGSAASGMLLLGLLAGGVLTEVRRSRQAALPT